MRKEVNIINLCQMYCQKRFLPQRWQLSHVSLSCDIASDHLNGVLVVASFSGTLTKGLVDNTNEKKVGWLPFTRWHSWVTLTLHGEHVLIICWKLYGSFYGNIMLLGFQGNFVHGQTVDTRPSRFSACIASLKNWEWPGNEVKLFLETWQPYIVVITASRTYRSQ